MRFLVKNKIAVLLAFAVTFMSACNARRQSNVDLNDINTEHVKNVVLFIGDGMGFAHVKAASLYNGAPLALESAAIKTAMTTYSLNNGPTDSSASATAMATGVKIYNKAVRMLDEEILPSIIDILPEGNIDRAFITNDYFYGATPASFLSWSKKRTNYDELLINMAETKANLIIGLNHKTRLLDETLYRKKGFTIANTLNSHLINNERLIIGLDHIEPEEYEETSLENMTAYSLAYLTNKTSDGFFLGVEGARIDKKAHNNDSEAMIHELLAFDRALSVALSWAERNGDTVVIVTADHETGGLALSPEATTENILTEMTWTTGGHTAVNVPFYFWNFTSDQAANLAEVTYDNTDIFYILRKYLLDH